MGNLRDTITPLDALTIDLIDRSIASIYEKWQAAAEVDHKRDMEQYMTAMNHLLDKRNSLRMQQLAFDAPQKEN